MLFDESADFCSPAQTGAYTLVLVESHADAVSRTAECDSEIDFTAFHSICKRMSYVRIVDAVGGICTEIHHFISLCGQVL